MEESDIIRSPIRFPRVELDALLIETLNRSEEQSGVISDDLNIVNIRGTNGSGKSTIPMKMIEADRSTFILVDNGEEVATVIPSYKTVAIGTYRRKTGGLDGIRSTGRMKEVLEKVKYLDLHILLEGILASTVFSTYRDIFYQFEQEHFITRKAVVYNILPPFETVKERVRKRNGGKEVKWEQVEGKYRTVERNATKFRESGLTSIVVDNSEVAINSTVDWFLEELEKEGIEYYGAS